MVLIIHSSPSSSKIIRSKLIGVKIDTQYFFSLFEPRDNFCHTVLCHTNLYGAFFFFPVFTDSNVFFPIFILFYSNSRNNQYSLSILESNTNTGLHSRKYIRISSVDYHFPGKLFRPSSSSIFGFTIY